MPPQPSGRPGEEGIRCLTARDAARQPGSRPAGSTTSRPRGTVAYHVDDDLVFRPGDVAAYWDHYRR